MNIVQILKNRNIVNKILFTLLALLAFRAVATIPLPGIPASALKDLLSGSSFFQVIGLLSGGLLESIGILTIGLGPYINASYIFQLLGVIVPQIKELQQGGPMERKTLTMYTRLVSIPLAIIQSLVIYSLLNRLGLLGASPETLQTVSTIALLTFGAMFSMWLGELMTEFGLGGGTSMIILAGILISIPRSFQDNFLSIPELWKRVALVGIFILLIIIAIVISSAFRKVKLIYARRVRPSGNGGYVNYIPLSINPAGVMPVIFAISILDIPRLAFSYLLGQTTNPTLISISESVVNFYNNQTNFDILFVIVTVAFTFLSAFIVFRPSEVAENINKQGAYIEGVRPGKATEKYLTKSLLYAIIYGALLLALITVLPTSLVTLLSLPKLIITGTGALILASVILDSVRQIQALYAARQDHIDYY